MRTIIVVVTKRTLMKKYRKRETQEIAFRHLRKKKWEIIKILELFQNPNPPFLQETKQVLHQPESHMY